MREIDDARHTPAATGRCAWCKADRDGVALDTGEELCRPCLKWCRRYGRDLRVVLRSTPSFRQTFWPLVVEHLGPIFQDLGPPVDRSWPPRDAARTTTPFDECAFCAFAIDQWDDDVDRVGLDTGECLCSTCLRNFRQYRRSLHNQTHFRRDYVPPADRDRVRSAVKAIHRGIVAAHPDDDRTGWHGLHDPNDATVNR